MAMTGRLYTTGFKGVSVSAVQDLIAIYAGATKTLGIHSVSLGQITQTTVGNLKLSLRYLPVTVTPGTVGSAGTVGRQNTADAAATATSRINDTSQATTNGTAVDLWDDVFNPINGFLWVPPVPGRPFIIGLSGAFIVSLDTAPGSAMVVSGSVTFEELP